jgi:hypothetical protein
MSLDMAICLGSARKHNRLVDCANPLDSAKATDGIAFYMFPSSCAHFTGNSSMRR